MNRSAKSRLKIALLFFLKGAGVFHLCRHLRRRELRILCYHGISLGDEHLLDPVLFMRGDTFARRLRLIKKWRLNVLPLARAVEDLPRDRHPDHSLVITLDDGWYSTLEAARILKEAGFPSTVYVSTYYCQKKAPVFNVLARYLFWKKGREKDCRATLDKGATLDLEGEARLLAETAASLGIELGPIISSRRFHFMTEEEMLGLKPMGMDVQLHTHRHRFPLDETLARAEIRDNRAALAAIGPGPYLHFCFPSGIYERSQFPWLEREGVASATTTRSGFNSPRTSPYELDRVLDGERMSDLEFEAELCGVLGFLRGRR